MMTEFVVSKQDKVIENDLVLWGLVLDGVVSLADFVAALGGRGYDLARLEGMKGRQREAFVAYEVRTRAMTEERDASAALKVAFKERQRVHADFRIVLQGVFEDRSVRESLAMAGKMTLDLERFLAQTRAAYQAVLDREAYLTVAGSVGYGRVALTEMLTGLTVLEKAASDQERLKGAAKEATARRNVLYGALKKEMRQFVTVAKVVGRGRADWLKVLGG